MIREQYNEIMKLISAKYGQVNFQSSGGALLVQRENITIGCINRKNILNWETIIDTKLQIIDCTPKVQSVVDETNVNIINY